MLVKCFKYVSMKGFDMVCKIDKLTKAQLEKLPHHIDKWLMSPFRTDRADFVTAKRGVLACYKAAKLPAPQAVFTVSSPMAGAMLQVAAARVFGCRLVSSAENTINRAVNIEIHGRIKHRISESVRLTFRQAVSLPLVARKEVAGRTVSEAIVQEVDDRLFLANSSMNLIQDYVLNGLDSGNVKVLGARNQKLIQKLKKAIDHVINHIVLSPVDISRSLNYNMRLTFIGNWISQLEFYQETCKLEYTGSAASRADRRVLSSVGAVFYHRKFAILVDRPTTLSVDDELRLHCDNGPAVEYADGWKLWFLNGMSVDKQLVMHPEDQTMAQINGETNADIRAIRIQRYGWTRYLQKTRAKCLDTRNNDIEGTIEALYEDRMETFGSKRLVTTCPTGRVFVMGVPPEIRTCEEAQNWLAGDSPFRVLGRT